MKYCPANISVFDIWVNNGTSQCFMDTVTSTVLGWYLLIFGSWHLWMYRKYGTPQSYNNLPKSKLYYVQLFFTYLLSVLAFARFFEQVYFVYNGQIYWYMVSIEVSRDNYLNVLLPTVLRLSWDLRLQLEYSQFQIGCVNVLIQFTAWYRNLLQRLNHLCWIVTFFFSIWVYVT